MLNLDGTGAKSIRVGMASRMAAILDFLNGIGCLFRGNVVVLVEADISV